MKKIILVLALFAGLRGAAHAQSGVRYGLKGGVSSATFASGDAFSFDDAFSDRDDDLQLKRFRTGFTAGGFVNVGLSKRFALQPEVLYSQKGGAIPDFQGSEGTSRTTLKSTVGYLDVPVLLRAHFGRSARFFVELGPQVSFVLHNRDFTQSGATGTQSPKNTRTDDLNRVVAGYASGLGYEFANGLRLGLRSTADFISTYQDGASKSYLPAAASGLNGQNPDVRNLAVQLQVEYAFGGN